MKSFWRASTPEVRRKNSKKTPNFSYLVLSVVAKEAER
jgi:hypothetical protein